MSALSKVDRQIREGFARKLETAIEGVLEPGETVKVHLYANAVPNSLVERFSGSKGRLGVLAHIWSSGYAFLVLTPKRLIVLPDDASGQAWSAARGRCGRALRAWSQEVPLRRGTQLAPSAPSRRR